LCGILKVPKVPNGVPHRTTSTPPAMDNPQATASILIRGSNYLSTLPFPIPFDVYIVPPTNDIPSTPTLVKLLQHGHSREIANFDLFNHPVSCCLGIDNEFIPNALLDLRYMSLSAVEHFVITLNPNGP
jgi:hypothetical protein